MNSEDTKNRTSELAKKVLSLARDSIVVRYRFFDRALAAVKLLEDPQAVTYVSGPGFLRYDPAKLINDYMNDANSVTRLLLLGHCL